MDYHKYFIFTLLGLSVFFCSCHGKHKPIDKDIVSTPEQMDQQISDAIKDALQYANENAGKVDDSISLKMDSSVNDFYSNNDYQNIWSHEEKWQPLTDSLYRFIQNAALSGLFPNDYHLQQLASLKARLDKDSVQRRDASLWTKADLMLTDAFIHIARDLKVGRIPYDSISLNKDSALTNNFYTSTLKSLLDKKQLSSLFTSLEPTNAAYWQLKSGIKDFIDSMDKRIYTYVSYPYKANNPVDSLLFIATIKKRLRENDCINVNDKLPDSTQLKLAIKKFQKLNSVKEDGLVSASLIRLMNSTDVEKFKRIAITLDRYKHLPDSMPEKYIWVNLPGYYLQLWDHDTLALLSKVICGKPTTRTPLLTSTITNMVTYPTWTVPASIVAKEFLPKLKTNPNYLAQKGFSLVDKKGDEVDATKIKWSKYKKGIPYNIRQGSGDDNALGVLKFNFNNKYAIYLHDTNQRYLFKKSVRSLSHGCVRVQDWEQLAFYIIRNDSANSKTPLAYNTDSLVSWLAQKKKKTIYIKNRLPVFIRYFGCDEKDGKILFYDDMYNEDATIRNKYFPDNNL